MIERSVLLVTLPPFRGGVPVKAAILARHLRERGWRVSVGYYATLGDHPDLVVPSWRLGLRRPGVLDGLFAGEFPCRGIGCHLPEWEASYTRISPPWRELIARHSHHVAVGGTPLVANLLRQAGVRHLLWCAASVQDDRAAREQAMPVARRLFDALAIRPALLRQQRQVLASPLGTVRGVSGYTCRVLRENGAGAPDLLPIPTDMVRFSPPDPPAPAGVIGFSARLGDPRKRVPLLLEAVALLVRRGLPVRLRLAGDAPPDLSARARRLGIGDQVDFLGYLDDRDLPRFYRGLDVFALPSSQEGLGIVGIEAMACGVPVVAAARGYGPDDYVIDGETGLFCDPRPEALAEALAEVILDRSRRAALSRASRALVEARFSHAAFAARLEQAWRQTWGEAP